jgi:hypothetical protein
MTRMQDNAQKLRRLQSEADRLDQQRLQAEEQLQGLQTLISNIQHTERQRLAEEAETKRLADEAEAARREHDAREAAKAERIRHAQEAEADAQRLAEETETERRLVQAEREDLQRRRVSSRERTARGQTRT